jgi:acetoin utilization deacetylase AcuC-like enzyme
MLFLLFPLFQLMEVNPKLVLVLEGGYDEKAIAKCSSECVRALLGSNRKVEKSGYVLSQSTWNKVNLVCTIFHP